MNMKFKANYLKFLAPAVMMFAASCTKEFLDINTDPNNPTRLENSKLLPLIERNIGDGLAMGGGTGGLSQILSVYTHQQSTREEPDQYGARGSNYYIGVAWPTLYENVLANAEQVIQSATELKNYRYAGIAKILKAYTYSQLVDVFGDVPFTEANQLKKGIRYPKFDDDAAIYPALFTLLDAGIADLNNPAANVSNPGADDIIYGGNVARWVKAANTIKLKLLVQMRKVKDVKAEVTALLADPSKLISSTNESFIIPYGPNGATDDRNPGFQDYTASQRTNHVSPWFYEILKGYNTNILRENPDPRLPYYIYNQLTKTKAPDGQTEYRDSAFVSIYFGSGGPDRDRSQQNSISLFGIYPVGGRYDDGLGGVASTTSGTGAAPYRMITYADRLYLEAELIKEGVVSGDARTKLSEAVTESFRQVDFMINTYVKPSQSVPAVFSMAANSPMQRYLTNALAEYDAKPAQQLQMIMTQKWISNVGNAVDQYTDYRRTGFPILFNPNDPAMAPGGRVQPPVNGDPVGFPGAQRSVPVSLSRAYPASLPWYQLELETNPNAPAQKAPSSSKVFWMP
jgi:hypothetical protein